MKYQKNGLVRVMEKPRPSTLAWIGLGTYVAAYDYLCPKGETMSEGCDRYMETPVGKILTIGAVALTASHLINMLPDNYDPFRFALKLRKIDEAMDVWGDE